MKINIYILFVSITVMLAACNEDEDRSDAYGNFEAVSTLISAEANGKLLSFAVTEGADLKAGQIVAQIDTTQLHLQKMQIQATINTLPQKLRTAIDDIQVLQQNKANLIREKGRIERLIARNAATTKQLDDITGQIDVIDQQIVALQTQTETANAAILSEKGPLIAQMQLVNDQIARSTIYNPIEGTVLTKLAEQYEMVMTGSPLYRIGSLDTMTFKFYVDAVQLQDLRLGEEIDVLVDSGISDLRPVTGVITWISSEAEFTPRTIQTKEDRVNLVYALEARVANPDNQLKIGMPGEVRFDQ